MRTRTFKEVIQKMKKMTLIPKEGLVEVKDIQGRMVPMQPWPARFFVSSVCIDEDRFEITKLTFTMFMRTIIQNFITMNYHRFMLILHWIGFLETPEACCLDWSWFRWDFWRVRSGRKLGKKVMEHLELEKKKDTRANEIGKKMKKILMKLDIDRRQN